MAQRHQHAAAAAAAPRVWQDNALSFLAHLGAMDRAVSPVTAVMLNQVCATVRVPRELPVRFELVLQEYGPDSAVPPEVAARLLRRLQLERDERRLQARMAELLDAAVAGGFTGVCDVLARDGAPLGLDFNPAWSVATAASAAASVDWLLDSGFDFDPRDASYYCAAWGDLGRLARLRDRPREGWHADEAYRGALKGDDPDGVLGFLYALGHAPPAEALHDAALACDVGAMDKLLALGAPLTSLCLMHAIHCRSLPAVRFLCERGCPAADAGEFDDDDEEGEEEEGAPAFAAVRTCVAAAFVGAADVLAYLHDVAGHPVTGLTLSVAARGGHREMVAWLRSRGCPWTPGAYLAACSTGDEDFVRWIVEAGCLPVPDA